MIFQYSRKIVTEDRVRAELNLELLQYYDMYSLWNSNGHLGQLFSRVSKCTCFSCKDSRCKKKHTYFYFENRNNN